MYEELSEFVARAARTVARKWPGVVLAEDVEQDIWVRLLESPGSVSKLIAMTDDQRNSALEQIGHQLAASERDDYAVFNGNVYYGTKDVRRILEKIDKQVDQVVSVGYEDKGTPFAVEEQTPGSITTTEKSDLTLGMARLAETNHKFARIVFANYWADAPVHDYPSELTRAVDRLTVLMNRIHNQGNFMPHEGPGARKVVSSTGARIRTTIEETGDVHEGRH